MPQFKLLKFYHAEILSVFFDAIDKSEYKWFKPHDFSNLMAYDICNSNGIDAEDFYFGYFDENKLIGYALLRTFNGKFETPSLGLYLLPKYRGKGYGKDIIGRLISFATFLFDDIMLTVNKDNNIAIQLYESCGFGRVKEIDNKYIYKREL